MSRIMRIRKTSLIVFLSVEPNQTFQVEIKKNPQNATILCDFIYY